MRPFIVTREQAIKDMMKEKTSEDIGFMLNNPMMKDDVKQGAEKELRSRGFSEEALAQIKKEVLRP